MMTISDLIPAIESLVQSLTGKQPTPEVFAELAERLLQSRDVGDPVAAPLLLVDAAFRSLSATMSDMRADGIDVDCPEAFVWLKSALRAIATARRELDAVCSEMIDEEGPA